MTAPQALTDSYEGMQGSPRTIVISQPMYFPWIGQLEQIKLANVFIFYDDVQYARGFFNRVQIKPSHGNHWMTVPLRDQHRGQLIADTTIDERIDWRHSHIERFKQVYKGAPYLEDALHLMSSVFTKHYSNLSELSIASVMALVKYFHLGTQCVFLRSSELNIAGHGTRRIMDICSAQNADRYLTGHGAANYLGHTEFEEQGIDVTYIKYGCQPYPQLHGEFTPYVSALDLVANCGQQGARFIGGHPVPWRDFVSQQLPNNGGKS